MGKRKEPECHVDTTLTVIEGRWRGLVIRELLFYGTKRFGELHKALDGISHRILTRELRALERHKVVHREVYKEVPPKVEYTLTPLGESLKPILDAMNAWGKKYEREVKKFEKD